MFGHAYNINHLSTLAKMNFLCFYQSLIVIDVTLTLFMIQLLLKEQTMVWYCQGGKLLLYNFFLDFHTKNAIKHKYPFVAQVECLCLLPLPALSILHGVQIATMTMKTWKQVMQPITFFLFAALYEGRQGSRVFVCVWKCMPLQLYAKDCISVHRIYRTHFYIKHYNYED